MEQRMKLVILEWHESVNSGDAHRVVETVGDQVVVLGPRGAGSIGRTQFLEWMERSGIALQPHSWHPVSDRLMVVEQDATWPGDTEPVRIATVFRVVNGKVTAALRLPDLDSALNLAGICRDMAATE